MELSSGESQISAAKMASQLWAVMLCAAAVMAAGVEGAGAPAPAPEKASLTGILEKGSQFTTLLRLLKETQIGTQLENQLENSYDGITVFAPTDNAFNNLKPGTLNKLTPQNQVALLLYHVVPRFYTFDIFQTASNPIRTQATGDNGVFTLNITSIGEQQANISTGVVTVPINSPLYKTFPIAVFPVDTVLLPYDLFGAHRVALSPPPPPPASINSTSSKTNSTDDGDASPESSPAAAVPGTGRALVTAAALFCMAIFS